MTSKQRWQDWVLLVGGIWLFVAPWVLGTSSDTGSSSNAWTLGVLIAATAWWALAKPAEKAAGWLQALFGAWMIAAPWLVGFTGETAAAWNAWAVGAGVVALAVWVIAEQSLTPGVRVGSTDDHLAGSH
ncbi:MAG: SPW repeat protein [Acidimicrobiia bacterium]